MLGTKAGESNRIAVTTRKVSQGELEITVTTSRMIFSVRLYIQKWHTDAKITGYVTRARSSTKWGVFLKKCWKLRNWISTVKGNKIRKPLKENWKVTNNFKNNVTWIITSKNVLEIMDKIHDLPAHNPVTIYYKKM